VARPQRLGAGGLALAREGVGELDQVSRGPLTSYFLSKNCYGFALGLLTHSTPESPASGRVRAPTGTRIPGGIVPPHPQALTVDDMVLLRGDLKAIQQGQELVDTLFPIRIPEKPKDEETGEGAGEELGAGATAEAKAQLRQRARARQQAAPEGAAPGPADGDSRREPSAAAEDAPAQRAQGPGEEG
jgi:hypothetical protein